MVDGFTPEESYLREDAQKVGKSEMLTKMEKLNLRNLIQYGHPDKMSENSLFNLFDKLIFYITTRQLCPSGKGLVLYRSTCEEKRRKLKCSRMYFTSGNNFFSLDHRIRLERHLNKDDVEEAMPVLRQEYENNKKQAPDKHYLQNVVVFRNEPDKYCGMASECCWRWVDLLNFEVKRRETYVDYEAFRSVWAKILYYRIERYVKPSKF